MTYKQGATTIGDLTYTYDTAGNRIKTGGTFARSNIPPALTTTSYNANNQQTAFGTSTETYDLNGNLATTTDGGVTTTYTWNTRNQLTGISKTGFTASFTYDSFGRRTGKTINGTTTNFLYDGLNPVQEKNGGTVTANLLAGFGMDEFFTRTDGVGVRALLPDALGSTIALGDNAGTLQTQYTNEPFGFTTQTGSASTSSYKYTGREDDGTGLMYYRARYYQPRMQRFISEDPIGFLGGDVNLYAYVLNSPLSYIDPYGLEVQICRQPALGFLPFDHQWIKTETVERGMGGTRGTVPGNQSGDWPGDPVQITNHSGRSTQPGASCKTVDNVDENKVNELLQLDRPLGRWTPTNQCQSFVRDVLKKSRNSPGASGGW